MKFICVRTSTVSIFLVSPQCWEKDYGDEGEQEEPIPQPHPSAYREKVLHTSHLAGFPDKVREHEAWVIDVDILELVDMARERKVLVWHDEDWGLPILEIYDDWRE